MEGVKWRLVKNGGTEPRRNLAFEEYLCRLAELGGGSFFMLWRDEPSVIIGRFQSAAAEVNVPFAEARNIPIVRRNSGGGAVYHDLGNVNYSFIVQDGAQHSFAPFAGRIIRALSAAGAEAEFSLSRNDISVNGRKVSGMAQYRHNGVLLCHGTLLFDCGLDVMERVLNVPGSKLSRSGVKSVHSRVTNLKRFFPRAADTEEFMDLIWKDFREHGEGFALSGYDELEIQKLLMKSTRPWHGTAGDGWHNAGGL